jgi:hypothetical protein
MLPWARRIQFTSSHLISLNSVLILFPIYILTYNFLQPRVSYSLLGPNTAKPTFRNSANVPKHVPQTRKAASVLLANAGLSKLL